MKIYKGLLSVNTLRACFDEASTNDAQYVGVLMDIDGRRQLMTIQNHDFEFYKYYYIDGFTSEHCPKFRALAYSDSFRELSRLWNI